MSVWLIRELDSSCGLVSDWIGLWGISSSDELNGLICSSIEISNISSGGRGSNIFSMELELPFLLDSLRDSFIFISGLGEATFSACSRGFALTFSKISSNDSDSLSSPKSVFTGFAVLASTESVNLSLVHAVWMS